MKISYNTNEFLFDFPFYQQTKILLSFIFCLRNINNMNHKQTKNIMINYLI